MISILERSPLRVIVDGFTMISAALLWLSPRIIISITMPLVIAETLRIPGARCVLSDEMPAVSLMKLVMAIWNNGAVAASVAGSDGALRRERLTGRRCPDAASAERRHSVTYAQWCYGPIKS